MGVEYIDDHYMKDQVLQVDDTPENRVRFAWYFRHQYHHYRYQCKGVYGNGHHNSCHTKCIKVIEGMEKNKVIEEEIWTRERMNMPEELMRLAFPENKMVKHKLITFKLED